MDILIVNDAAAERWDDYVRRHAHASPYHAFAWKRAVETAYGQQGHYLMALDGNDQVVGVLPAVLVRPPVGRATLCSLPYCDRGEALADSPAIEKALIDRANELRRQLDAGRYEYRASTHETCEPATVEKAGGALKVRMLLQLESSSEKQLASFKAKLRSQIKKAQKNGLTFETGNDAGFVAAFYEVFTTNMRDLGSPTHSRQWFESISRFYGDNCLIAIVRYGDIAVGAGLILIHNDTATIPWASTLRRYNRLAPNMLLYWSLLQYASDHGCRWFDFGRSSVGEGTYRFKKQWGARPVPLDWRQWPEPVAAKTDGRQAGNRHARRLAEGLWRKLPLPLTIQLGSIIRKYITL